MTAPQHLVGIHREREMSHDENGILTGFAIANCRCGWKTPTVTDEQAVRLASEHETQAGGAK